MSLKVKICKCLASNLTNMSNFHPLEVVSRYRETQLQVGGNLNLIAVKWIIIVGFPGELPPRAFIPEAKKTVYFICSRTLLAY